MRETGRWDIQAHTKNGHGYIPLDSNGKNGHFYTNKLWRESDGRVESDSEFSDRVASDLKGVKQDLEKELNIKASSFAYPFGDFGDESINYPESKSVILDSVRTLYKNSFYQVSFKKDFSYNFTGIDNFLYRRISVKPNWSSENLLQILSAGKEKSFPFYDDFTTYTGWTKTIGRAEIVPEGLTLKSGDGTTGSIFLDGTRNWKDYAFSSNVDLTSGSNVSLLARYRDDSNYLSCNFSANYVRVEEKIGDKTRLLAEVKRVMNVPFENLRLGVKTMGNSVGCLVGDKVVIESGDVNQELNSGGIGLRVWGASTTNNGIKLRSVDVDKEWKTNSNIVVVSSSAPKKIPYIVHSFNQDLGWINKWGDVWFEDDVLLLRANDKTTGSMAVLSGTEDWADYSFEVKGSLIRGSNIVLLARYVDDKNYIALNLGNKSIRFEQYANGVRTILSETLLLNPVIAGEDFTLSIRLENTHLDGYLNGKPILSTELNNKGLKQGGIGIKSWDALLDNSEVVVKSVIVEAR
jgi:hypothetical protein